MLDGGRRTGDAIPASRFVSALTALVEGVGIALDSLRASKARAALTIVGVAIGVAVVMAMASAITGLDSSFEKTIESTGPKTFFVFRYWSTGLTLTGPGGNAALFRNPPLTPEEAVLLRRLPSVRAIVIAENANADIQVGNQEEPQVPVAGRSAYWPILAGGDMVSGRSYTAIEEAAGARVVVLSEKLAARFFGGGVPEGRTVKIGGQKYEVLGVWTPPPDLFGGGSQDFAIMPWVTFHHSLTSPFGSSQFLILPTDGATMAGAMDEVTAALRASRGLRPTQENNFALVTQDKILDIWNQLTGVFFVVMLALSGVGLMVGGVGVVAVMMISVTERTREIGVRKALGATRGEILWQFLVEAATLTLIGGAVGMVLGGGIAYAIAHLTPVPARVPLLSIVAALLVSILTGVVFGIVPAQRAARMDPVEALRYE
jgi:putative ABC transport system permease protein